MNSAWLHVSGDTLSGSPLKGLICSGSTPEGSALDITQRIISIGCLSWRGCSALAISHCATQSVQMNHGLPEILSQSSLTWWNQSCW